MRSSMKASAWRSVTSDRATARSAWRPATRNSCSPSRATVHPLHLGADHDEALRLGLGRSRLVHERRPAGRAPPCTPCPVTADMAAPDHRVRGVPAGDVGLRARPPAAGRSSSSGRYAASSCSRTRSCSAGEVPSSGARSSRRHSTRARSMWRRNCRPRPLPSLAPSMRPGMSATTNSAPSPRPDRRPGAGPGS